MKIDGHEIGNGAAPFIVAEIGGNHGGSASSVMRAIRNAKQRGADAAKLQMFDPYRLAERRGGFDKVLASGEWQGCSLGSLYKKTALHPALMQEALAYAADIDFTVFASAFDPADIDYLETLGCPAYKISSFEAADHALIRHACQTGKPVIVSTGMLAPADVLPMIQDGIMPYCPGGAALLHCVSEYPCPIGEANLGRIAIMRAAYGQFVQVGLSDHTLGSVAPVVATALGASIIEKHFTLSRSDGGPDAAFSLEPAEFGQMVRDVRDAHAALQVVEAKGTYRELAHG